MARAFVLVGVATVSPLADGADLLGNNLLDNGGFELPDVSLGCWKIYTQSDVANTSWNVASGPGFEILDRAPYAAKEGNQYAELDSIYSSEINQRVPTVPGNKYRLRFWYSPKPKNSFHASSVGDNGIWVKVDNDVKYLLGVGRAGNATIDWKEHFVEFVAASNNTLISFADVGRSNGHGGLLDDISVYEVDTSARNRWRPVVKSQDPFYVLFDQASFDDSGWLGNTLDPMSVLLAGETYEVTFGAGDTWTSTGNFENPPATNAAACDNDSTMSPDLGRIVLACRDYSYTAAGEVIDPDFGKVGRLRQCSSEAEEEYLNSVVRASVTSTEKRIYVGGFTIAPSKKEWKGQLAAYAVSDESVSSVPSWRFEEKIDEQAATGRRVFTHLGSGDINLRTMNASQANLVYTAMGIDPLFGSSVVNFLLNPGLNALFSGSPPAIKTSRLSAIYNSAPLPLTPPDAEVEWGGPEPLNLTGYELFKQAQATRSERVFIGSNTGMMHAVCEDSSDSANPNCGPPNAGVGSEVFAFVPPSVLPRIDATRNGHTFTVNGSFGIADVCLLSSCPTALSWKTVLVGSLHRGGRSLYALDVTNTGSNSFLWEFTDAVMGETWSPPTLARANVLTADGDTHRWVAVAGGGYLSPEGDNSDVSNSVVVVDLKTGGVLQDNTLPSNNPARFARFRVDQNPASCATNASTCILPRNSVPGRVAFARNGKTAVINYAYLADTQGRMWVMDLTVPQVSTWAPKLLFDPARSACRYNVQGETTYIYDPEVDPSIDGTPTLGTLPLPNVTDPRPIFQRVVAVNSNSTRARVFAGTGDVFDPIWEGPGTTPENYDYFYAIRHVDQVGATCAGAAMWVKRFRKGEKMLSEAATGNGVVFIPTYRTPQGENVDLCGTKGDARIYAFYQTSGRPAKVFDPDANPATVNSTHILELKDTGYLSNLTFLPDAEDTTKGKLVFAKDDGTPMAQAVTGGNPLTSGAIPRSWRRIR